MNNNVPSMKQAVNLWLDGIKYRQEHFGFPIKDEYIFHTRNRFCVKTDSFPHVRLNPETAYICVAS